MRKLGLSHLLRLVVVVPLVVVAVFGGVLVYDSFRAYRDIERVSALGELVAAASRLTIIALNKESDASHAFVTTGAERERTELNATRQRADQAIRDFKSAAVTSAVADAKTLQIVGEIEQQLRGLDEYRREPPDVRAPCAVRQDHVRRRARDDHRAVGQRLERILHLGRHANLHVFPPWSGAPAVRGSRG